MLKTRLGLKSEHSYICAQLLWMWQTQDSLGCCSCCGWLLSGSGMSCVCDCESVPVLVCVLACGLCPLAQVTRQNPVVGLEQADSKISLRVEHSAVFWSSSNRQKPKMHDLTSHTTKYKVVRFFFCIQSTWHLSPVGTFSAEENVF